MVHARTKRFTPFGAEAVVRLKEHDLDDWSVFKLNRDRREIVIKRCSKIELPQHGPFDFVANMKLRFCQNAPTAFLAPRLGSWQIINPYTDVLILLAKRP